MKKLTKMTYKLLLPITAALVMSACKSNQTDYNSTEVIVKQDTLTKAPVEAFEYVTEQFADLRILRYEIPGFDELTLQQKELLYYLSEAALCGRDIIFDQTFKYCKRNR